MLRTARIAYQRKTNIYWWDLSFVRWSRSRMWPASGMHRTTCIVGSFIPITYRGRLMWWRLNRHSDFLKAACRRHCFTLKTFTWPALWPKESSWNANIIRCSSIWQPKIIAVYEACWRSIRWHQWPSRWLIVSLQTLQLVAPCQERISLAPNWNWRSESDVNESASFVGICDETQIVNFVKAPSKVTQNTREN